MKLEWYRKLNKTIRTNKVLAVAVLIANQVPVLVTMFFYGYAILVILVGRRFALLPGLIIVPLATFLIATWLRKGFRMKRPYLKAGITPIAKKKSDSYSFPSRHVTSAFVIGVCLLGTGFIIPGWVVLIMAVLLAAARVLGGVHFIRDVAAGGILGVLLGLTIRFF